MGKISGLCSTRFLPYDLASKSNGSIQVGLKEYAALLRAFLEAVKCFHGRDLTYFDSLVGENACEIRAVIIAILASKKSLDLQDLENRISNALFRIDVLLAPKRIEAIMRGKETLQSIVDNEEIDISLGAIEYFILNAYLLTVMKADISTNKDTSIFRIEATDPKKLKRFGEVSISFARGLISQSRRYLATASVQFIQKIAFAHQELALVNMFSDEFIVKHNTLPCAPMFWTYKAVIAEALRVKIPLILHVKFLQTEGGRYQVADEDYLLFEVDHNGCYVESTIEENILDKAGWIVQGIVTVDKEGYLLTKEEWRENIRQTPVVDMILAGAAAHRQYPDPSQDSRIEALQDPEFTKYRSFARAHGFSSENPTTFFIQHVYAAYTGVFLQSVDIESIRQKEKVFLAPKLIAQGKREMLVTRAMPDLDKSGIKVMRRMPL